MFDITFFLIETNWRKKGVDKNAGLSVSHEESHLNIDPCRGRRYWH